MIDEVRKLSRHLGTINSTAEAKGSAHPSIPNLLIGYVENGRNPDIYTREFVEGTRRTNQIMRGKTTAFASFRDILAGEMEAAALYAV